MQNTFKYSIIRVEPDIRRGERVNVGLVVFKGDELDVRILDSRKASTIASHDWDAHIRLFTQYLNDFQNAFVKPQELVHLVSNMDKQINLTDLGWFEASNVKAYEEAISKIAVELIKRPTPPRKKKETSVISEIAASFKSASIMASRDDEIDSGLVVRNYLVDAEADLKADFALQNGYLHLASTLDLTSASPRFGTAAEKAVTLDLAKKANSDVKAYGVYAVAPSRMSEVKEHIAILGDYADHIFNWAKRDDQEKFKKFYFDAYNSNNPLLDVRN